MRIAVIGATGYTGLELIRLLTQHNSVELTYLTSDSQVGAQIEEIYPHLQGMVSQTLEPADAKAIAERADVALVALPGGLSTKIVPDLLEAGLKVIDLGGDHRLNGEDYQTWYKKTPPSDEVLAEAVYGLPELYAEKVQAARLIANPGCYPTATLLSLLPLLKKGRIDPRTIVVDAKSGVSGAGKALSIGSHFVEVNENFKAYKVGTHQHIPEIERILSAENPSGEPVVISFTTHLVPMTRGILVTCYAQLTQDFTTEDLLAEYADFYGNSPFVRVLKAGNFPQTKDVYASNFCDIGLRVDPRTKRVTVIGVIDNLVKGASGQAVQNLNLLLGLEQTTGLQALPVYL